MKTCKNCQQEKELINFAKYRRYSVRRDAYVERYDAECRDCKRRKKRTINPKRDFIYIISTPVYPGWIKLGRTSDLKRRLISYNTQTPLREFAYAYKREVTDACMVENHFKQTIPGNGYEWFNISAAEGIRILKSFIRNNKLNPPRRAHLSAC